MVATSLVVIAIYYPKVSLSNGDQTGLSLAMTWLVLAVFMLITGMVTLIRSRRM